jgi:chromosome segregation ATPase
LNKSKNQIAKLEQQLKSSGIESSQMKKTLIRLQQELTDKTNALVAIQTQLASKDQQIAELSESVNSLSSNVQQLQTQTTQQADLINKQATELNTVYFCFGTSKE